MVAAARVATSHVPDLHLLFVGSGRLGDELRAACRPVFDVDSDGSGGTNRIEALDNRPRASFAGFLNQSEIAQAYAAADCLVLPSDHGETWGLVVNEAMASGLPCVISDHCGCAEDLGVIEPNQIFPFGDIATLAERLSRLSRLQNKPIVPSSALAEFTFARSVRSAIEAYSRLPPK